MLANLNGYNKQQWMEEFTDSKLHQQLDNDFDVLMWEWSNDAPSPPGPTARQYWGQQYPSSFSVTVLYYLETLFRQSNKTVYDIGCGWNIFKKYYPQIVGIGAEDIDSKWYFADQPGFVNAEYVAAHQDHYDCFFSINALHFRPVSEVKQIVEECASMLTDGGSAFITFNTTVLVAYDKEQTFSSNSDIEQYIRTQLSQADVHWRIVDINLDNDNEGLDGNVRLLFTKV